MTEQNVAAMRNVYEAFNGGDLEGVLAGFDPDIEVVETQDLAYAARLLRVLGPRFMMLSGGYRGVAEVKRIFESAWEIAEWFRVEPEEFIALGDRVVVLVRLRAKAKDTGIEGEALTAHLWTMKDGRATRWEVYPGKPEALAAAAAAQTVG
jgi:ketosteroid isomerase-like protein